MTQRHYQHALNVSKTLLIPYLKDAKTVVDMTCGNGWDSLFLAEHMVSDSTLYMVDIQKDAIETTKNRLISSGIDLPRLQYCEMSHDKVWEYIPEKEVHIVVFNLGYLPHGNHEIHTRYETTIAAIEGAMKRLISHSLIHIVAYPGTPYGKKETEQIESFLKGQDQKYVSVSSWKPLNQIHEPPLLYIIQKR